MKSLLLEMTNQTAKRVDVPDEATFTFGAIVPGSKSYGDGGWGLRVKVGKEQIAVITGVKNCWVADLVVVHQTLLPDGKAEEDPFQSFVKLTPSDFDTDVAL